jgi:beta-glucosidase
VWEQYHQAERMWMDSLPAAVDPASFSARLETTFVPEEDGRHTFSLVSAGYSRLYVDGQLVADNWEEWQPGEAFFGTGSREAKVEVALQAGQPYALRLEFSKRASSLGISAVRVGHLPPVPANAMQQAALVAAEADVALLFLGLGGDWESEGFDRPDMELPADQVALLQMVAAANPNTVVVLNTGSPVTMNWLDKVAAVVQAWYPGQECGNAIADVLFGDVNPSGRLPQTFPVRLQDNPAYINYPGENGRVHYGEGIFVGYRYYDKKEIAPLFPFGYGLSYTTFAYSDLQLSVAETAVPELEATVAVTNTGSRAGQEVVQLYVSDGESAVARPPKELKGLQKVWLEPGETKTVNFQLSHESLAYYDDDLYGWRVEAGEFVVGIGRSAAEIVLAAAFRLTADHIVAVKSDKVQPGKFAKRFAG